MLKYLMASILLLVTACDNNNADLVDDENNSWVFVANEGSYGSSNGSISMIDNSGNVYETDAMGDVVQSLEVWQNKLIVLINNSKEIRIFDITSEGLSMPGITISLDSDPREMVIIDDNVYFTNWSSNDVKVFNLYTYNVDASIPVGIMPEGIITDGVKIWVANSGGTTVSEIDVATRTVTMNHEVGEGPQNLIKKDNAIYVSRTYYSSDWTETYHGASKVEDIEVTINNYGAGVACGGAVLSFNNKVYRSANGGVISLFDNLELNDADKIGAYDQSLIYHVEVINDHVWFALTDYTDLNEVKVVDFDGNEINSFQVGLIPGDLAYWQK